eukprot:scaffold23947_cov28-Tisochrysis_lutea.AAC.4
MPPPEHAAAPAAQSELLETPSPLPLPAGAPFSPSTRPLAPRQDFEPNLARALPWPLVRPRARPGALAAPLRAVCPLGHSVSKTSPLPRSDAPPAGTPRPGACSSPTPRPARVLTPPRRRRASPSLLSQLPIYGTPSPAHSSGITPPQTGGSSWRKRRDRPSIRRNKREPHATGTGRDGCRFLPPNPGAACRRPRHEH